MKKSVERSRASTYDASNKDAARGAIWQVDADAEVSSGEGAVSVCIMVRER